MLIVRASILVGLVLLLVWQVDLGAALRVLQGIDAGTVIIALLGMQLHVLLSAARWRLTAAALGQRLSWPVAIGEYHVAGWLNQVLPGGVSGDVLRVVRNRQPGRDAARWHTPAHAVMLERLAGQLAFAVVAVAGLLCWLATARAGVPSAGLRLAAFVVLGITALAGATALLAHHGSSRLPRFLADFGPALRAAWFGRGLWLVQGALSLAIVACYLAVFALASRAVGAPLDPVSAALILPLALLTMLVPVSVAGWVVREAAAAALWPLAGYSSADGVAASVVYGLVTLVGAAPGAAILVWRPGFWRHQRSTGADSRA